MQRSFSLLAVGDVGGGTVPLDDGAPLVEQRHGARQRPADRRVGTIHPVLDQERRPRADRPRDLGADSLPIVPRNIEIEPIFTIAGRFDEEIPTSEMVETGPVRIDLEARVGGRADQGIEPALVLRQLRVADAQLCFGAGALDRLP